MWTGDSKRERDEKVLALADLTRAARVVVGVGSSGVDAADPLC